MTSLVRWFAVVTLLAVCSGVRAEDRLRTLERELELHAERGKTERIWSGVFSLALAGTLVPAGIVMLKRDDDLVRLIGIGTLVTGAVQLLRLPEFIFPSDMERMRASHQRRRERLSGAALVAETEREWREKAAQEHRVRKWIGAFNLGLGVAALPVGLTFMLRDQVGDMEHRKQLNVGSTLLGIGVGYIGAAAMLLIADGPTESSWKEHAVSIGLAPVAFGGQLTASGRF
ncbi:MAG: hypothetical protein ABW352_23050 [Polyangiales bacterium]